MCTKRWWLISFVAMAVCSTIACGKTTNLSNQAGAAAARQFDWKTTGDAARAQIAGKNPINNPPVDLRNLPKAHPAGTTLTDGRMAGNALPDQVAKLMGSIPGVTHTAAIGSGKVIIIGLGLHKGVQSTAALQHEVRRRVLTRAPVFRYVYVATNPRQVTEINRIADGIRAGHPPKMYRSQMRGLMTSLSPIPWP